MPRLCRVQIKCQFQLYFFHPKLLEKGHKETSQAISYLQMFTKTEMMGKKAS